MDSANTLRLITPATIRRTQHGFTLVETLVTIAILAILLGIAVPSFDLLTNRNRAQSTAKQLLAVLQYARAQAQIGRQPVHVKPQTEGDWTSPLLVTRLRGGELSGHREIELRRNRLDDSGKLLIAQEKAATVAFDGNGIAMGEGDFPRVFTLTAGSYVSKICLQRSGVANSCD
ncbi:GspH/FimT family pseudopilin [Pseudomonas sp. GD04087]|uniref:GspH/FimT family pseudopilin n=1 Tax=unclassified Pseudomonas TaxID=196821 RepID=UPI00244D09AD|nr:MULTISPECIES: GspH/FimT family pseudopilin [unclassified Pseudomonas]MDH0291956.1 GspH/FimT family pseudopilin [Pseudomonas sp. GD04087]MDH1049143.1 GspH/FimT family pseudopilin [Pseudomonas sp. GD03903]MDH1999631.1 GspH/FimT family pseudopilin [Pseudomonas sp. GD03691]